MRHCLSIAAAALLIAPLPAFASSIQKIGVKTGADSIVTRSCSDCPQPEIEAKKSGYIVPSLKQGTQTVEIRDINGERKMVRTEAWMGGSPVVYITKAPKTDADLAVAPQAEAPVAASALSVEAQAVQASVIGAAPPAATDGIDPSATTSALGTAPDAGARVEVKTVAAPQAFDASQFELRLQR